MDIDREGNRQELLRHSDAALSNKGMCWSNHLIFVIREEIDDLAAFQRQYDNDHSWEDLQEDEFGRLLSLVNLNGIQTLHKFQPNQWRQAL